MKIRRRTFRAVAARLVAALVLPLALGGCGLLWKKKPPVPEATLPAWVGRVVMVDADNRFALLDTGAPAQIAPGTKLLAFREQRRTATLTATADSRPPYMAADIAEGLPSTGDQVALDETHPPQESPPQ